MVKHMSRVLGLDLGTTFFKGAVLDLGTGAIEHVRRVPTPGPISGLPRHHELDPAAVLDAVRRLIGELLQQATDAAVLWLSSQMHCVVLTDERGRAESNVITWKDQRGLDPASDGTIFDEIRQMVSDDELRAVGREVRIGLPVTNLFWLARHNRLMPGRYATSLPDFVLANLCDVEPTTEATNAAAHGLFDLAAGNWHFDLIERLGLSGLKWPRVRPMGEVVGTFEIAGRRLTCHAPIGDQQAALAGAEFGDRELSLNLSTGSQVSLLANEPSVGDYQVRPYFNGRWLRTIVQVPAGRSLAVLVDLLSEFARSQGQLKADPWDFVARASERVHETDLAVVPTFFGTAFGATGSIANIREDNLTAGHLFLATFQWMADTYAECARRLSPEREWDRIVFSGSLAQRFPRLRELIVDRLGGVPHRMCPTEEDALRGLLLLARGSH